MAGTSHETALPRITYLNSGTPNQNNPALCFPSKQEANTKNSLYNSAERNKNTRETTTAFTLHPLVWQNQE